jgi:ATP phosphoribosyltransferase regulatory subunit
VIDEKLLKNEERAVYTLRNLYRSYGYRPYKMSKFEEYELYLRNKDFLVSDRIITFNDTNGKLMALKPDVTLSIVRASRPGQGELQKLYYDENVYRVSENKGGFREIRQAGLECVGAVDEACVGEVLSLALESLKLIAEDSRLCVSLLGVVEELLDSLKLEGEARRETLRCLGEKNTHELKAVCESAGVSPEGAERLRQLALLSAAPAEALPRLSTLGCGEAAIAQAERLSAMLPPEAAGRVSLDFSILGDMRYYNGIVFQGYVPGVPSCVLSGGSYDRLLKRMGKKGRGIGFACYLDKLERLEVRGNA